MGAFCGYMCQYNLFDIYYSNSDDDFLAVHAVEGASESWEKSVTPVTNLWHVGSLLCAFISPIREGLS